MEDLIAGLKDAERFIAMNRNPTRCPRVILLIGAPGTGKSTFIDGYLKETSRETVVLGTDILVDEYAAEHNISYDAAMRVVDFKALEQRMGNDLRHAAIKGHDIVIDRTNMRFNARNRWLSNVPKHYVKIALTFSVPTEELFDRLRKRSKETGKYVPHEAVREMLKTYQPPTYDQFDIIKEQN